MNEDTGVPHYGFIEFIHHCAWESLNLFTAEEQEEVFGFTLEQVFTGDLLRAFYLENFNPPGGVQGQKWEQFFLNPKNHEAVRFKTAFPHSPCCPKRCPSPPSSDSTLAICP